MPTIHYQMGGVPTNIHGQVVAPKDGDPNAVVNGLYAVGECSCVSVHGANRLGTNSLLDLLVFGRAAGNHIVASQLEGARTTSRCRPTPPTVRSARLARLEASTGGEYAQDVANDIRTVDAAARRRVPHAGADGRRRDARSRRCASASRASRWTTSRKVFNTARIEALEVDNLIEVAQATIVSAAARKECRGAHVVDDYEEPADDPSPRTAATTRTGSSTRSGSARATASTTSRSSCKPLTVDSIPPKVRTF